MKKDIEQKIIQANIDLHREEASVYDKIHPEIFCSSEQNLIKDILKQILAKIKKEEIKALDLGAGTGNVTLKLLDNKKISSLVAVDLSEEMLDELKKRAGLNPKLKIVNKPADEFLAEDEEKYNLIVISSVLHHLPDYFRVISLILKKLKPGGCFIIFHEPTAEKSKVLNFLEWLDIRLFVNLFLPKELKKRVKTLDHSLSDYHVYHDFDMEGIKKHFESKDNLEIIFFKRRNVFGLWPFRLIGKFLPQKNNFILAVRKK